MAALPRQSDLPRDAEQQWRALGIAPLSAGAKTGLRMDATPAVEPVAFVPKRAPAEPVAPPAPAPESGPLRIRGQVGDGLYWSLRAAGASPPVAAQYLAALATAIDVGEVTIGEGFDLVLGREGSLLYAGLDRVGVSDLQLVRWTANGRSEWINAADAEQPEPVSTGMSLPVAGRITSTFGYRVHPILRFKRFHGGVDFGAGWAGGYGRQVRIAHGDGLLTSYSHMSEIVAESGTIVRQGQLIGYVGSSGLSTGPHLHYEVKRYGERVNPLSVQFTSAPLVDARVADAVRARVKALLSVGIRRS